MTKTELLAKKEGIVKKNDVAIQQTSEDEPYALAHENASTILELSKLIDDFVSGGEGDQG